MDIILIAGMWLDARAWARVAPRLEAAGHRPVPLTLPGQDGSTSGDLDAQVDAVVKAIDAADGPAVVVGHSAAATLAWIAADRRPATVARVVLVGGFPEADGAPYFDVFPAVDGAVPFPGWEPIAGPDSDDLDDSARAEIDAIVVPVAEGVGRGTVRYTDDARRDVPVTLVCPEFSAEDAREWIAAGDLPELAGARSLDLVDIDSGHWPMVSRPGELAAILAEAARVGGTGGADASGGTGGADASGGTGGAGSTPGGTVTRAGAPAWEPPLAGTEAEHLGGALDRLRATFRWKADGLTIEQLRRTLTTSDLSLGALLTHLAVCEDDIFAWKIAGERPEARAGIPDGADAHAWQFTVAPDATAEGLYALYDAAVRRSRERFRALVEPDRLGSPAAIEFDGVHPSVRRFVVDLLEEYGRHTGHADLLREAIDGRVGEDPDPAWRWDVLR